MATTTHIRIGPADQGRTMSLEEFREAEEVEGYRYELARGVLEVTEIPDDSHRQIIANLSIAIVRYHLDHPGFLQNFGGGADFRLWLPGMISGRNPDFGVVLRGAPRDERGRQGPALVAEVVSPASEDRDYRIKREEYLHFGIQEYWIIDPRRHCVTVLVRREGVWNERTFQGTQRIESVVLPDFPGTVAELWVDLADESGGAVP